MESKVADVFNRLMANSFPFKNSNLEIPIQDFKDFSDLRMEHYGHLLMLI